MVSEYNFSGTLDFGVRDLDNEKSQTTLGRMATGLLFYRIGPVFVGYEYKLYSYPTKTG